METNSNYPAPSHIMGVLRWLLLALGSAYFVWGAWQVAYSPSMDYAVVVEMARNMASGADFPAFFYGQSYMGSLEPAASALLCAVFGFHPFCVCMGTALFGIAILFAVMRIARRLSGDAGACLALAFAICGGPYWLHFMVSPRGGYSLAALLALMAIAIGATWDLSDAVPTRTRALRAAAAGFAAGLAFWNFWLALPAFAAAALLQLARLRRRALAPVVVLPAAGAFFVGSAPWWAWVARNGLSSVSEESGGHPLGLRGPKAILFDVVEKYFGVADAASFWRSPFPWVLAALLLLVSADAAFSGSRERSRFFAGTLAFSLLFLAAYCLTPFGARQVARYFIVLVPCWAVACGAALGAALRCGASPCRLPMRQRAAAAAALAAYAVFVAPPSLRRAGRLACDIREQGRAWAGSLLEATEDPSLRKPAFADFRLFGANWATDRRLCFVSPLRWRYRPYLLALEKEQSPAVIRDFMNFSVFCKATRGKASLRNVAGFDVTDAITPPPELREIDSSAIADILDGGGGRVRDSLIDDNIASFATASTRNCPSFDIVFREPQRIAGVRAVVLRSAAAYGWRAEALDENGAALKTLSVENPHRGWFWSGPRPYMFGPDSAWELRWKPRRIARLRIVFEGRGRLAGSGLSATVSDLRVLSDDPLPPLDAGQVAEAVVRLRKESPGADIKAGRWLGGILGAKPDPALEIGATAYSLAHGAVCRHATLDPAIPNIVAIRGGAADCAEETLRSMGCPFSRTEAGGCSVFSIPPRTGGDVAGERPQTLRFYGGRLLRDSPDIRMPEAGSRASRTSAVFGGRWGVVCLSELPESVPPGGRVPLEFLVSGIGKCRSSSMATLFVHALRDGKIVSQGSVDISGAKVLQPADAPVPWRLALSVEMPRDLPPGPITLAYCVKEHGALFRHRVRGDAAETDRRRVVIGRVRCSAGE